jgi:hypothetical protein
MNFSLQPWICFVSIPNSHQNSDWKQVPPSWFLQWYA